VPLDRRLDRETGLVESEAAGHIADRELRRLEKAAPSRELIVDLVVMDQRELGERGLRGQARIREQGRRTHRIDPFLHQMLHLSTEMIICGADRDVERAVAEIALAGHRAEVQLHFGNAREKSAELWHQPERGDRGRRCDREFALPASSVERQQRRFQFVEALGQLLKRIRGGRRQDQFAALALEQGRMQKFLERTDLMADGRRGHTEFDRSAREA
jgi:hypothetical protein